MSLSAPQSVCPSHSVLENALAPAIAQRPPRGIALTWHPVCHITYTRDTWVKLLLPLSEYAYDAAKLLCQASATTWVAWVPEHGEVILDRSHFYCA